MSALPPDTTADTIRNQVITNAVGNIFARSRLWRQLLDPRRSIEDECGFPAIGDQIEPEFYDLIYQRDPVPARYVEIWPKEAFLVRPEVYEDDDPETVTPWEEARDTLYKSVRGGDRSFRSQDDDAAGVFWNCVRQGLYEARKGRYGVILIGFSDGKPLHQPVKGVEEKGSISKRVGKNSDAGPTLDWDGSPQRYTLTTNAKEADGNGVNYLRAFPERLARITQKEVNPASPRYGHPTMYQITMFDPEDEGGDTAGPGTGTTMVHWTRVVHVCEKVGCVYHIPPLKHVLNNCLGIRKIDGASPEAVWKGAINLLVLETHPELGGDVNVNEPALKDMVEEVQNGMQKWMILMGMTAKSVPPTIADPKVHSDNQIEKICIRDGIPVPVFKGYEIGEQASTENRQQWDDRVTAYCLDTVVPAAVEPLWDRFILAGAMPEPADGYKIKWGDRTKATAAEKATVLLQTTQALSAYVSGGVEQLIPPLDYLSNPKFLDLPVDEAEQILEAAAEHVEEQQQADMDQQSAMIEEGLAPNPTAPPPEKPVPLNPGQELVHPSSGAKIAKSSFPPPNPKPVGNVSTPNVDDDWEDPDSIANFWDFEDHVPLANKEKPLTGGRWVTTDDGHRVYIRGGKPVAGNPKVVAAMRREGKEGGGRRSLPDLHAAAVSAGEQMYGKAGGTLTGTVMRYGKAVAATGQTGLVVTDTKKVKDTSLSKTKRSLDEYEWIFHPSTGKGFDPEHRDFEHATADWADKDGYIYTKHRDVIHRIKVDRPLLTTAAVKQAVADQKSKSVAEQKEGAKHLKEDPKKSVGDYHHGQWVVQEMEIQGKTHRRAGQIVAQAGGRYQIKFGSQTALVPPGQVRKGSPAETHDWTAD